jgi:hypothetical protein
LFSWPQFFGFKTLAIFFHFKAKLVETTILKKWSPREEKARAIFYVYSEPRFFFLGFELLFE